MKLLKNKMAKTSSIDILIRNIDSDNKCKGQLIGI